MEGLYMKTGSHTSAFVLGVSLVLTQIAGCGGGGGGGDGVSVDNVLEPAKQYADGAYIVRPAASWEIQPGDVLKDPLAFIDLSLLNNGNDLPAGTLLQISSSGSFFYNEKQDESYAAAGLLVDKNGNAIDIGNQPLDPVTILTRCGNTSGNDSVSQDFVIPSSTPATLAVPAGATALRLSVVDCYFQDNSPNVNNPIRISIKIL
jgi:hypothetical protein